MVVPLPLRPAATPAPVAATSPRPLLRRVGALSGQPQVVDWALSINPNCSSEGAVTYVLRQAPSQGTVTFPKSERYPIFPATNLRSKCNDRQVPTSEVVYTSAPGFHGVDHFAAAVLFPTGQLLENVFDVTVE